MERFSQNLFAGFITWHTNPVISLYLPTVKKGPGQQQNPIRIGNLIKDIRSQFQTNKAITHQLKENLTLLESMSSQPEFWQHLKQSMVIFVTDDPDPKHAIDIIRLPIVVDEAAVLAHRFYLKPLLPLYTTNGKYYLLTLSQNDIKLYVATRTDIDKHYLGETIPTSLDEYMGEADYQSHLQFHTKTPSTGNARAGVFHGQGAGDESFKADIKEFVNQVENGITDILESQKSPLVLAGVEYLTSMYRDVNKYKHLVEAVIEGNPEDTDRDMLHQKSWGLVRPIFKQAEHEAVEKFGSLKGTGKTSTELEEIIKAAFDGRVETLFITRDMSVWGHYYPNDRKFKRTPEDDPDSQDLFDLATFATLDNSGTVYSLKSEEVKELGQGVSIAAILRY